MGNGEGSASSAGKKVASGVLSASSAVLLLGTIGLIAHLSQREFLGLPVEHLQEDVLDLIKASAPAGVEFLWTSITRIGFQYMAANPLGIAAAAGCTVIMIAALTWFVVRRRRQHTAFEPLIVLPVIFTGALIVIFVYDVPTQNFQNVLRADVTDTAAFEVSPRFSNRASVIWRDVICSRLATYPAATMCRQLPPATYRRNLNGRYFFNFSATTTLFALLVIVFISERKRLFRVGSLLDALRLLLFVLTAVAVLVAVIGVPYVYSRTVRSTEFDIGYPQGGARSDAIFNICTATDRCVPYRVNSADFDVTSGVIVKTGESDDALRAHLLDVLGVPTIAPPPQPRFGGQ